uniref:(northern house mosquito) hypothetical protein n=1 Tax=Culex pipiens TaxID=7175 RepID=A0A8D8AX18_CULPI
MGGHCEGRGRTEDHRTHPHGADSDRERLFDVELFGARRSADGHAARPGYAEKTSVQHRSQEQLPADRNDGHANKVPRRGGAARVCPAHRQSRGGAEGAGRIGAPCRGTSREGSTREECPGSRLVKNEGSG